MQDKMKALMRDESSGRYSMKEVSAIKTPCKSNWVVLKTAFAAVSGTDLLIFTGQFPMKPDIPGHRFSGVVSAVGKDVTTCKVGDRVVANPSEHCGTCKFCKRGKIQHCLTGGLRSMFGMVQSGGYAEHVQLPASQVEVLPAGLSLKDAVLSEPLSCVLHSFDLCHNLRSDSKILVIGAGVVGLLWATVLNQRGFSNVMQSEPVPQRRDIAKGLNPNYKIYQPDELNIVMQKVDCDVDGFDVVVDCSGDFQAFEQTYPMLARGATYLMFGVGPMEATAKMHLADLVFKEICIQGSAINPFAMPETVNLLEILCNKKCLSFEKLGMVIYEYKDYVKAFEVLKSMKVSQVVLKIGGEM